MLERLFWPTSCEGAAAIRIVQFLLFCRLLDARHLVPAILRRRSNESNVKCLGYTSFCAVAFKG